MTNEPSLRRSPLHALHTELGAQFTDFAGWEMPLRFGSELDEHRAVRDHVGIFDLSHMGEVRVRGSQAAEFLTYALTGDFGPVRVGRAKYALMLADDGGILDDLIVYRLAEDEFLLVPNAENIETVLDGLADRGANFDAEVTDETAETAVIAVQGPASEHTLTTLLRELVTTGGAAMAVAELRPFSATQLGDMLVARTGYTGEDGFEIFLPAEQGEALWRGLLKADGVVPAGLAARDSLRLEAGLPLYGNELSTEVIPFEAGLGWVVSLTHDFVGRKSLENRMPRRVLVGLFGEGRRAGRRGYPILHDGEHIGEVTSGLPSPTLGAPFALGFVDVDHSVPGTSLTVDVRGTPEPFTIIPLSAFPRSAEAKRAEREKSEQPNPKEP